jgi:hypothetical protein
VFGLDRLNPPSAEGTRIERSMLTQGVIPAYTYSSEPAEPAKECPTICVPLILVAQDDVNLHHAGRHLAALRHVPPAWVRLDHAG